MSERSRAHLPWIGWREWVSLPSLGLPLVKAKVDTGARSSALHAFDVKAFRRKGEPWVRFKVHPLQRKDEVELEVEARVHDRRHVRSSSGHRDYRYVIRTEVEIMGQSFLVELTLSERTEMGFRMLLGREAMRGRFLVDPGGSYHAGRHKTSEVHALVRSAKRRKATQ